MDYGKKRWFYEAGLDWMMARKKYLTATDIVSLLPELKRARKGGLKDSEYGKYSLSCVGIWAEKTSSSDPELFAPSNDAARGHVLEPFAVKEFNRLTKTQQYPWDDMLIADDKLKVGFSPDALSIEQPIEYGGCIPASSLTGDYEVTRMLEIKSYAAKKHTEMLLEPKEEHKERYQIATAMIVLPSIKFGAVMFYNPSAKKQIGVSVYKRDDLEDEIADIEEIIGMYNSTAKVMEQWPSYSAEFTEDQIYQEYIKNLEEGGTNLGNGNTQ